MRHLSFVPGRRRPGTKERWRTWAFLLIINIFHIVLFKSLLVLNFKQKKEELNKFVEFFMKLKEYKIKTFIGYQFQISFPLRFFQKF